MAAVRYAVVGLGHIAQVAVLPAFAHARRNTALAALVSDDAAKRKELARRYKVPAFSYDDFDQCLEEVDAVCTRAIIIAKGKLVADDTPAGLKSRAPSGRLEDVFRAVAA